MFWVLKRAILWRPLMVLLSTHNICVDPEIRVISHIRWKRNGKKWERSGSVVECLTRD